MNFSPVKVCGSKFNFNQKSRAAPSSAVSAKSKFSGAMRTSEYDVWESVAAPLMLIPLLYTPSIFDVDQCVLPELESVSIQGASLEFVVLVIFKLLSNF